MSLPRFAARRDKSEPIIVEALEAHGFSVQQISVADVPDLIVGKLGVTRVVEVKTDDRPLSDNQLRWWANWNGNGVIVLRTVEDVQKLSRLWSVFALKQI